MVLVQTEYLGLALGMALKFYTSVARELKVQIRRFLGIIIAFVEDTLEKMGVPPPPILRLSLPPTIAERI